MMKSSFKIAVSSFAENYLLHKFQACLINEMHFKCKKNSHIKLKINE